jgi:small subunit ribosomal protein S17
MMEQSETTASDRNQRRTKVGRVASSKMTKTIVVVTDTPMPHPAYGKILHRSARFLAHDEKGEAAVGDTVKIMETRPMSARKRWRLIEIVEKAK